MKELSITIRVKNNLLLERRQSLGLSQKQLAMSAGVGLQQLTSLEGMQRSPMYQHRGVGPMRWTRVAQALANFYDLPPEDLFPETVRAMRATQITFVSDLDEFKLMMIDRGEALALPPGSEAEIRELIRDAGLALATLTPREEQVLRMRFGIGVDEDERTLDDIGQELGLCRARIRQIQEKALRKLRHPYSSKLLAPHHHEPEPQEPEQEP